MVTKRKKKVVMILMNVLRLLDFANKTVSIFGGLIGVHVDRVSHLILITELVLILTNVRNLRIPNFVSVLVRMFLVATHVPALKVSHLVQTKEAAKVF